MTHRQLVADVTDFSPSLTFECGQCFRFYEAEDGVWRGVALGKQLTLSNAPEGVLFHCGKDEFNSIWRDYFDLDADYAQMRKTFGVTPFMEEAVEYGRGIRILRQDFWEAFCSFIISQCNNIPRIRKIVERLCAYCGEPIGENVHAFPGADIVARLSIDELRSIGAGYRAEYIVDAARAVADGSLSYDKLSALPFDEAKKALCSVHGVGDKVANCVLLYGLHRLDAFPLDVWMKRALREHFPPGFDYRVFGESAGLAQQYIFHFVRNHFSG